MKIFHINKQYNIVCNSQSTRYGFKHTATLCSNGFQVATAKQCYYNRTWESFEYETVILNILNANFEGKELIKYKDILDKKYNHPGF